jgi:hypothetical protein
VNWGRGLPVATFAVLSVLLGLTPAASARPGFVEPPRVVVGDSDGDGLVEASATGIAGAPCACRCPVVGAVTDATAAGQDLSAETRTALVVCGTGVGVGINPNAPDLLGTPHAGARLRVNPNGLGRGGPAG